MTVANRLMPTLLGLSLCAFLGGCGGLFVGMSGWFSSADERESGHVYPYPHHISKQPDGVSLRFAMVNDVLHERFPRHGVAYYKERNRQVRQALVEQRKQAEAGQRPSDTYFALLDDLAVGLEFVGEHDEALHVMSDKLKQQEALGISGRELYSSYANLGTFLILGPFRQVRPGNEDDKKVLREGLALIQSSIRVNPDAHFGREIWQAVLVEYMIALLDRPDLLTKYDMIGNALDWTVDPSKLRCVSEGGSYVLMDREVEQFLASKSPREENRQFLRSLITQVGAEGNWKTEVSSFTKLVPFDEPTLGIIGMWRLGGGAHPYFALALGETMLRVGQRYLAWSAYERAARLSALAWPETHVQKLFEEHCRARQKLIESQLPTEETAKLRPAFEKELAHGQEYQKTYQRYEEEQIAAGRPLDDPHFYDAFHAAHGAIASPVGPEDQFVAERMPFMPILSGPAILLFAGLGTLAGSLLLWLLDWWRRRRAERLRSIELS